MLEPWVVQSLLWIYKGGLAVMFAGAILLRFLPQLAAGGTTWRKLALASGALLVLTATFAAGFTLRFGDLTLQIFQLSLLLYVAVVLVNPKKRLTPLLVPGILGGVLFGLGFAWVRLDDARNPLVPFWERPLSGNLACRAYPAPEYSTGGTRLVVVRKTPDWFHDEVVDEIKGIGRHAACQTTADGRVILRVSYNGANNEVTREVELPPDR